MWICINVVYIAQGVVFFLSQYNYSEYYYDLEKRIPE